MGLEKVDLATDDKNRRLFLKTRSDDIADIFKDVTKDKKCYICDRKIGIQSNNRCICTFTALEAAITPAKLDELLQKRQNAKNDK